MNGAVQGEATAAASTPGEEGVERRIARAQRGDAGRQQRPEFEHAGEVEADEREQRGERRHDAGRLQLKAPAELLAARARRDQQAGQREEGEHHARGVGQRTAPALARGIARVLRERQHLERQHREHAGHQVEDHAA